MVVLVRAELASFRAELATLTADWRRRETSLERAVEEERWAREDAEWDARCERRRRLEAERRRDEATRER